MVRFFLASSTKQEGSNESIYFWFRVNRTEPIGSYRELIRGYDEMDDDRMEETEDMVDKLLTEDEVHALQEYLHDNRGLELNLMEISIPVDFEEFHFPDYHECESVYNLWEHDESALPFPVRAYCLLEPLPEELEEELAAQD